MMVAVAAAISQVSQVCGVRERVGDIKVGEKEVTSNQLSVTTHRSLVTAHSPPGPIQTGSGPESDVELL